MPDFFNPPEIGKPLSQYSHGAIVEKPSRWLYISGQVGTAPDGTVEPNFEDQARRAWANLFAVLRAGGMEPRDLVKITYFLTRASDLIASRAVRDSMLQGIAPTSTLLIVAALARPDLLIEVEAVAAR